MVVELNDGRAFLGTLVRVEPDVLKVMTGYVGHPATVYMDEVDRITPALSHPDVEVAP